VAARRLLRTRRYLLPLTASRVVQQDGGVLVEVGDQDLRQLPEVPAAGIPPFSEDDLLTAIFAKRVA
jgi:hypothetical protein